MQEQIASVASGVAYCGSAVTVVCGAFSWVSQNHEFIAGAGIIAGGLIAAATFLVNAYYKRREDARRQERHEFEIGAIRHLGDRKP